MKFNYGAEKKKFEEIWKRLEKEYAEAGMSRHAIEEMKAYDWEVFKKERTYCSHNQKINEKLFDNGDEIEFDLNAILEEAAKHSESAGGAAREFLYLALKDAVIEGYILENPAYDTKSYRRKKPSIRVLNKRQTKEFLKAAANTNWYSHSVTRLIKTVMNTCMDYAKKNNLVSYNPARGVNLPKQIEKREYRKRTIDTAKTLNLEQILTLIKASEGTSIHMQVLFAVLMGLRRGEINGLKYSDIDYINRTLTIKRQLGRIPNTNKSDMQARTYTKQEIPPKTRSSERTLNIPDYVFEEILKERTKYEKNRNRRKKDFNDQDYICCSSYGHPRSMSFHFKPYKQLLKECELPDIRWHDLRSTFCTLLLKNDYSPKAVARMMGHAKEIITLDVYADNAQIIADGVQDMQDFIDDVLPDDGGVYKEHTDIAIDLEFLNEEDPYEELSDAEICLEIVGGICENAVG